MKKTISILFLALMLSGCGWFGGNNSNNGSQTPNSGTTTPNNGTTTPQQDTTQTNKMSDLFTYFDEQGLTYSNAKDVDVVDMNAHEGKMFEYENNPVYVYRMKTTDSKIKSWMDEIKNTGKVTINQEGKEMTYDAIVNGDYILVSKSGTDLKDLSTMFKNYEIK